MVELALTGRRSRNTQTAVNGGCGAISNGKTRPDGGCDLLKKHRRPTTLKEMLQERVRSHPANDQMPLPRKRTS